MGRMVSMAMTISSAIARSSGVSSRTAYWLFSFVHCSCHHSCTR